MFFIFVCQPLARVKRHGLHVLRFSSHRIANRFCAVGDLTWVYFFVAIYSGTVFIFLFIYPFLLFIFLKHIFKRHPLRRPWDIWHGASGTKTVWKNCSSRCETYMKLTW